MYGICAVREGAGIMDTDTSTWDLGNAGRKARPSAFERALAGLMFACFTVHKGDSCTASPAKVRRIPERLLVDVYWPLVLTAEQTAAEDLGASLGVLPRKAWVKRSCTPCAAKTRAMQLCSIHSDTKNRDPPNRETATTPNTRRQKTRNPALVSQ